MPKARDPWKPGDIDTWRAPLTCADENCTNEMPSHAWSVIKTEGWFHQKDGNSWCPQHTPDWVDKWREKRAGK